MADRHTEARPGAHSDPARERFELALRVTYLARDLGDARQALKSWERRLAARAAYEKDHGGLSELPALRQHCALEQLHCQTLALQLAQAQHALRTLDARRKAKGSKARPA